MSAKNPKGKGGAGGAGERHGGGAGGSGESKRCGLSSVELQRGFDGEAGAQDVAGHVASCDPCGSALELLQTQRDAVQFLTGTSVIRPADTAVEQILTTTARAGREKLADLLYEMSKACLIVLPDLKLRIERKVEPRQVPVVSSELRSINVRLEMTDGSITLSDVPKQTPEEARALKVARNCLAILDNVEGASERQQLAWSQLLIFEGNPAEAERALRKLLETGVSAVNHQFALRNVLMALNQQRKYAESAEFAERALLEYPDDCALLYNLSVAVASLRDRERFRAVSSRFAGLAQRGLPEWLRGAVRYEVPNFASTLGMSPADIQECFGLDRMRESTM